MVITCGAVESIGRCGAPWIHDVALPAEAAEVGATTLLLLLLLLLFCCLLTCTIALSRMVLDTWCITTVLPQMLTGFKSRFDMYHISRMAHSHMSLWSQAGGLVHLPGDTSANTPSLQLQECVPLPGGVSLTCVYQDIRHTLPGRRGPRVYILITEGTQRSEMCRIGLFTGRDVMDLWWGMHLLVEGTPSYQLSLRYFPGASLVLQDVGIVSLSRAHVAVSLWLRDHMT